ncbi:MAG: Stp1/IreP family PP2C-type Ser/Thr phosphatase [Bdellovibrionota bacterium]
MLGDSFSLPGLGNGRTEENIPAAITDIGCEREINEDRYAVIDSPSGRAWVVCDGMGGALGGELAAQLAIDAIRRALETGDYENGAEALRVSIEEANRVIVLRRQNPAFSGMGTTVVGAIINGDEVVITHAGDSRAYLIRDGVLQQLTTDHTYVQDLVERGAITPEEALSHPQSHVLTRCLGAEPRLQLDAQEFWIWEVGENEPEDKLVLCSDGLYSLVSDTEIADHVSKASPQEACVQLIELAKSRGGYDNITLAVLPLGGQLREESAQKEQPARKRRHTSDGSGFPTVVRQRMPLQKQLLLMSIFLLLGGAMAALVVLFSVANK